MGWRRPFNRAGSRTGPPPDRGARRDWRPGEVELVPRPEGGRQARVAAAAADCLLDRYSAGGRPLITARQHEAGLKLRALWDLALRQPRLVARYEAVPLARGRPGAEAFTAGQQGARRAVEQALALLAPAERQVAENVCRHDLPAGPTMNRLRSALDRLAEHWCLAPDDEED